MSRNLRLKKLPLGLAVALLALLPSQVNAQTEPPPPWGLVGSDTLAPVMRDAIIGAANSGVLAATGRRCSNSLSTTCTSDTECSFADGGVGTCYARTDTFVYMAGGSGVAESYIKANPDRQVIAPMSRNLSTSVVADYPTFAPTALNILGLDALVIVTANSTTRVKSLAVPLNPGYSNIAALNTNPAAYNWNTPGSGYTQILEVVLSGVDGSGSVRACANPRRLQAIQDLAAAQGTPSGTISHIYRHDDNSGDPGFLLERAQVLRFCNGRAFGVLGSNKTNPNLNNQDFDPIRRPCEGLLPNTRATNCTDMTTGLSCAATDGNSNCTQGLVVALSIGDNATLPDVTGTIAQRVISEADAIGFASRAAVRSPRFLGQTTGPAINGMPFDDAIIRSVSTPYLLARRLFLNYADADGLPNTSATPRTLTNAGGFWRVAAETGLYDWMRGMGWCDVDLSMRNHGFVTCSASCTDDFTTFADNFCNGPYETAPDVYAACEPNGVGGSVPGPQQTHWSHSAVACSAGSVCCSTGTACPASLLCPAANARPIDSACSKNSDCASNNCSDYRFIGTLMCGP